MLSEFYQKVTYFQNHILDEQDIDLEKLEK